MPTEGHYLSGVSRRPSLTTTPPLSWTDPHRPLLRATCARSLYTDASWRAVHPIQAQAVFGLQGIHFGRWALYAHIFWQSSFKSSNPSLPRWHSTNCGASCHPCRSPSTNSWLCLLGLSRPESSSPKMDEEFLGSWSGGVGNRWKSL